MRVCAVCCYVKRSVNAPQKVTTGSGTLRLTVKDKNDDAHVLKSLNFIAELPVFIQRNVSC